MSSHAPVPGHIGLNVSDLSRSVGFYADVFGFQVAVRSDADGRRFAFLSDGSQPVLTLWEQTRGRFEATRAGLHHLAFQVDTLDTLEQYEQRLRDLGVPILHGGIVGHLEALPSAALYFEDPDGLRLEVYSPTGGESKATPTPGAPACGFF